MEIKEITVDEFENFSKNNKYNNFRQSLDYALFKCDHGYEYEIIGFTDGISIKAAAVVLVKLIDNKYIYAYVPHGFLIDYNDTTLLEEFTKALIKYYKKDDIVFIKVNPPCRIAKINKDYTKEELFDNRVPYYLERLGYNHLGYNLEFEAQLPRYEGIINLEDFDIKNLTKNCRNKIRRCIRKGLSVEIGTVDQIEILNDIIGEKLGHNTFYYNDYYNTFARNDKIDFFLVKLNYSIYLKNSADVFENEQVKNAIINKKIINNNNPKLINKKMSSDKALLAYKNDISLAKKQLYNGTKYIAAGLVVKHGDTVNIVLSGYNKDYKDFAPNYLLFYEIINYYKNNFKYLTLNGMTGDFHKKDKYYGLNKFKMEFNPDIYEYAGEFDLIINQHAYNYMLKKNILANEFNK